MQFVNLLLLFFICMVHTFFCIDCEHVIKDNDIIRNLFHNSSKSDELLNKRESLDLQFAEGSSHNENLNNGSNRNNNITLKLHLENLKNMTLKEKMDALAPGAPATGTSKVTPRKGVRCQNSTDCLLQRGAVKTLNVTEPAPVHEHPENPILDPIKQNTTMVTHSRKVTNTSLPPGVSNVSTIELSSKLDVSSSSAVNVSYINLMPTMQSVANITVASTTSRNISKAVKPSITVVPSDSDDIVKKMTKDRNIIVPVLALVLAPLIVLLLLFIYKRYGGSNNAHYMRMGYLIEDIYND